jgi:diguanylate cyclase (GGDEF)-like protein/PAS domain S-box-containing protein
MADPDVSDGGRLAYMSPQIAGILGYRPDEFVNDPELWPSRVHPDDRAAAIAAYEEHWRHGEPLRAEYRMVRRDGAEIWVRDEAYAMPDDTLGGHQVSQGLLIDITDRKQLESKLIHDALHDPLTGLANRRLIDAHLDLALARAHRGEHTVGLLFLDLDGFKQVNEEFGHKAGDAVLAEFAERLTRAVRASDPVGRASDPATLVSRPGGDEFMVILSDLAPDPGASIAVVANRIRTALEEPFDVGGGTLKIGVSIGAAEYPLDGRDAQTLIERANGVMRSAKRARR